MIIEPSITANAFPVKTLENNVANEKLKAEKEKFLTENSDLRAENERLQQEIASLKSEIRALEKKNRKGGE